MFGSRTMSRHKIGDSSSRNGRQSSYLNNENLTENVSTLRCLRSRTYPIQNRVNVCPDKHRAKAGRLCEPEGRASVRAHSRKIYIHHLERQAGSTAEGKTTKRVAAPIYSLGGASKCLHIVLGCLYNSSMDTIRPMRRPHASHN